MHSGHRERLRKKFQNGILEDHELIELLLFYSIPRCNTNETAHMLLDKFGSISGIFDADPKSLPSVEGIGENSAILIRLVTELTSRYWRSHIDTRSIMKSEENLFDYIRCLYIGACTETIYAILLSGPNKHLATIKINSGVYDMSVLSIREIIKACVDKGAAKVILVHNHPDGCCSPSNVDIEATYKTREALKSVGLELSEHYIYADGKCVPVIHPKKKTDNK